MVHLYRIINLCKGTQINIAFRTQNTIQNIVKYHPRTDKYSKSGIYELICLDCRLKYIGQTGRTFNTRYKNLYPQQLEIIIVVRDIQVIY
jgi:hypothetical protein